MIRKETHYQVLGLEPGVSASDIKRAYRALVKNCHPDLEHSTGSGADEANEKLRKLNEAYETLKDTKRRAQYDSVIGLNRAPRNMPAGGVFVEEEGERERFLAQIFHPCRQRILKLVNAYQKQLRKLSQDIYDDRLVMNFEHYSDEIESALRTGSQALSGQAVPRGLEPAVQMMRYAIAQAADGLEEMRRFCQNYDYDHLSMAGNLFTISADLLRQSLRLTRN